MLNFSSSCFFLRFREREENLSKKVQVKQDRQYVWFSFLLCSIYTVKHPVVDVLCIHTVQQYHDVWYIAVKNKDTITVCIGAKLALFMQNICNGLVQLDTVHCQCEGFQDEKVATNGLQCRVWSGSISIQGDLAHCWWQSLSQNASIVLGLNKLLICY